MQSSSRTPSNSRKKILAIFAAVLVCALGVWFAVSKEHDAASSSPAPLPLLDAWPRPSEITPPVDDIAVRAALAPAAEPAPATEAPTVRPFVVRGRVLDLDRQPVANLAIGRFDRMERSDVRSAADGTFEINLTVGGSGLEAQGPGWATVWADRHDSEPRAELVTIVVAPAGRLAGVVVDQSGGPVPNALVATKVGDELLRTLHDVLAPDPHEFEYSTRTDERGRFDLGEIPLVRGSISAVRGERKSAEIELPSRARDDLELRLEGSLGLEVVVRGRVLDTNGAPAGGAFVGLAGVRTNTKDDGAFELSIFTGTLAADQQFDLVAVRGGALPGRISIGAREAVERVAGRAFELVLGGAPLEISGRVVDSDGKPVAGVNVWIEKEEQLGRVPESAGDPFGWHRDKSVEAVLREPSEAERLSPMGLPLAGSPVTADDGSFTIRGLQARAYEVWAHSRERMSRRRMPDVRAGTRGLLVELDTRGRTRRVRGRVVDRAGAPLAGVSVIVAVDQTGRFGFVTPEIRTGADGRFEIDAVRGSVDEITARLDSREAVIEPQPDDPLDDVTITLGRWYAIQIDTSANPGFASMLEIHDARSARMSLYTSTSTVARTGGRGVRRSSHRESLSDGLSDVFSVMEGDLTAVFFRDYVEVARIPIVFAPKGLTVIRP